VELPKRERRGRRLLIVEDDPAQAYLFQHLLKQFETEHDCHHVPDGQQALDFLRRLPPFEKVPRPELIVLDIRMPGLDGCAVLREIKRDPDLRCIPVVMLSRATSEEMDECYREQANACVSKQDDYQSMLQVVRQIQYFWFDTVQLPYRRAF
jgi:chemotaxis family two-component system response regulator Rcp1